MVVKNPYRMTVVAALAVAARLFGFVEGSGVVGFGGGRGD